NLPESVWQENSIGRFGNQTRGSHQIGSVHPTNNERVFTKWTANSAQVFIIHRLVFGPVEFSCVNTTGFQNAQGTRLGWEIRRIDTGARLDSFNSPFEWMHSPMLRHLTQPLNPGILISRILRKPTRAVPALALRANGGAVVQICSRQICHAESPSIIDRKSVV